MKEFTEKAKQDYLDECETKSKMKAYISLTPLEFAKEIIKHGPEIFLEGPFKVSKEKAEAMYTIFKAAYEVSEGKEKDFLQCLKSQII